MNKVTAEILDNRSRIALYFGYDPALVAAARDIPGRRFVGKDEGGPYWHVPLDMETCRVLRAEFGSALVIGPELKAWAWREVRQSETLTELAGASDAELIWLPEAEPRLAETLRPFQRAAARFIEEGEGQLIADEPGLGKTLEAIAGVIESGMQKGPNLVVAPKTSLDVVWETELTRWQSAPVYVLPDGKAKRIEMLERFQAEVVDPGFSGWLVINYASVRQGYPVLHDVKWNTVTLDEPHAEGLRNPRSATSKALMKLKTSKRIALTATPMGGRPVQLWGILHWLRPETFGSKWRWADQWLCTRNNGFGTVFCTGKLESGDPCPRCEGGIIKSRREDFNRHLTPYVLRRTKAEVLPELPPKQYVDEWIAMLPGQARQYREMAKDAATRVGEADRITANGILAEFTRLKQFAIAEWEMGDGKLRPTGNSNKLERVLQLLAERGITGDEEETGDAQVVIFSQFTEVVEMVERELNARGIETMTVTGKVKGSDRTTAVERFQGYGGPRVMLMNVKAGGVSITLDRADTVIFLDEWWAPDVMEQAEDRVHRLSRIHQVTIYYLRSKGTVEEDVMRIVDSKGALDKSVMDDRRKIMGLMLGEEG